MRWAKGIGYVVGHQATGKWLPYALLGAAAATSPRKSTDDVYHSSRAHMKSLSEVALYYQACGGGPAKAIVELARDIS